MFHLKIQSHIFIPFVSLTVVLAGCSNPFRQNYQSMLDKWPQSKSMLMQNPETAEPRLITSEDMKSDALAMLENGYLLIGKSKFKSPPIDEKQALDQAKKVGADVVLVKSEYVNTLTQSVPITDWIPEKKITTTERATFQENPSAQPSIALREVTQTLQGESYTRYVPKSTDYFEYSTSFWKKSKPTMFGVLVQPLDNATKKRLQSNRGVIVKVVVNKSPAYNADILRDDIIIQFADEPVADPDDFFDKIKKHAGQKVTVKVIRDGTTRDITLTLRAN